MSQALDLAMSICSGSIQADNIVHDWNTPLVVGSPTTGEVAIFAYNPVLHRMEIEVASQSQGDTISIMSFDSHGQFLLNDTALASQGNLEDAVAAAAASAQSAAQSAATAQASLSQVIDQVAAVSSTIEDFNESFANQQAQVAASVAAAQQAATDASASATTASSSVGQAQTSAGTAQAAAAESQARASANAGVTFADGTKSSAVYADLSRQYAQASRLAVTRALVPAGFPETFQPGHLFKRARVSGGGARVVTIPQGVWPLGAGEAWATYRLEETGSVQFTKQAGNTTGEIIPTLNSHTVRRARYGTLAPSQSATGTIAVPAVASGKLIVQACVGWATTAAVTITCTVTPAGGGTAMTVVSRQSARTPPLANQNPHFATFEVALTSFAGGDLDYIVVAGPDANFLVATAYVISNQGTATPIVQKSESAANGSAAAVTLPACPVGSIVVALGVQRSSSSIFSSFSANITTLASGNLQSVPTANDTDTAKNASWGYGVGTVAATGDVVVQANFANANGGAGVTAIAYPPGTGAVQPLVNMILVGGRDTLNQVGQEATLWFVPDGHSVYVNVPAA